MNTLPSPSLPPADIIIFGALGDLAQRKIWPALYHRFREGQLQPSSRMFAMDRTHADTLQTIYDSCRTHISPDDWEEAAWQRFASAITVVPVDADYASLHAALTHAPHTVRAYYLATPPHAFSDICQQLHRAQLITPTSRVVLEKPLGEDQPSFRAIDSAVRACFSEEQIYRIDHYLGKETVQNLMILRFANPLFANAWDNRSIERVEITVSETLGVEQRAEFYDRTGALRDMVQNHLLQLLCLIAMEPPGNTSAHAIRTEKIKVLQGLRPLVAGEAVREQYIGYTKDVGNPHSTTETYVRLTAHIDNWRWAGVPFILTTGKKLAERYSEVVVHFRPAPHDLFHGEALPNQLILRLQPDENVKLRVMTKVPGPGGYRLQPVYLNLSLTETFPGRIPDAYERLLMDVVRGNATLFMHRDEVDAAWGWIDAIRSLWAKEGMHR